jgi:hypothetical protein
MTYTLTPTLSLKGEGVLGQHPRKSVGCSRFRVMCSGGLVRVADKGAAQLE